MRLPLYAIFQGLLLFFMASAAEAAWTSPATMGGGTAISNLSCARVANDEAVCAMANSSGKFAVNHLVGGTWAGWTALNATVASDPSCAPRGTSEVVCVAKGTGTQLVYSIFNGTTWSAPASKAAGAYSAPSCARQSATKILCVVRNQSGGLSFASFTGTTWSAFSRLIGLTTIFEPSCASNNAGQVICAAVDEQSQLVVNRFSGGGWQGFITFTSPLANLRPACSYNMMLGWFYCVIRGTDGISYWRGHNGGEWTLPNWSISQSMGGILQSAVSCTPGGGKTQNCFTLGTTTALYHNTGSTWNFVGGAAIGEPACINLGADVSGKLLCVARGLDNRPFYMIGP